MPPPHTSADIVRHAGPPLILPGAVFTGLFVASLAAGAILSGGAAYLMPFGAADGPRYFVDHADAVRVAAFFQFGAAIPLGIFTATLTSRLRFLGIEATSSARRD